MKYRHLGRSGLVVSSIGLGCNNFGPRMDAAVSQRVVDVALDAGVTFFDTADIYGKGEGERQLGAALKGRRDDVVVATKFRLPMADNLLERGGSRRYVRRAVEASLRRLDTEWIDLYQMHTPDDATPIDETLSVLDDLIHEGKIRYAGSSNFAAWQIADADWEARSRGLQRFVSTQNQYNLLYRDIEAEIIPACKRFGIGVIPYYPLATGLLTGKYRRDTPPPADSWLAGSARAAAMLTAETFDVLEGIQRFADERGITPAHVAIGWLVSRPQVISVIAGASTSEQVADNVGAAAWTPNPDDIAALNRIIERGHLDIDASSPTRVAHANA